MPIFETDCWIGDTEPTRCHGCDGKGWVETSDHQAHSCPVCLGSGKYNNLPVINPLVPNVPAYPWNPVQPLAPANPVYPGIGYPYVISKTTSGNTLPPINISSSAGNSVGVVSGSNIAVTSGNTPIWPEKRETTGL